MFVPKYLIEVIAYLVSLVWKQLFQAAWRGFGDKIAVIRESLSRKKKLIESRISVLQSEELTRILEETQKLSRIAEADLQERKMRDSRQKRQAVNAWLAASRMESIHERHVKARSQDSESGHWLLEKQLFKQWIHPTYNITSLLWLNGKPGSGELISIAQK
jgi:hypothetical protein